MEFFNTSSSNITNLNITDMDIITEISLLNTTTLATENHSCDYTTELNIRHLSEPIAIVLVFVYFITAFLAILGNIVVIIVQIFGKRTAPILRKFLINLAISDIFIGIISIPLEIIFRRWVLPLWLCPVHRFVYHLAVAITSYTLALIAIERYYAVLYPLPNKRWTPNHCNLVIVFEWVFSSIISLYSIFYFKTVPFTLNGETYHFCGGSTNQTVTKIYYTSTFFVSFAIPLVILIYCYAAIGRKLKRNNSDNHLRRVSYNNKENQNINKMLTALVIAFVICWLPVRILVVYISFQKELYINRRNYQLTRHFLFRIAWLFFRWLSVANSFVNPIIYSFMCNSFRSDFKEICLNLMLNMVKFRTFMVRIFSFKFNK